MIKNRLLAIALLLLMVFSTISTITQPVYAGISDITVGDANEGYIKVEGTAATTGWQQILNKYKNAITGISGVAALTFLVFFIINFSKLGSSAGNPQMRSQALLGIVWCGIACAGLGGIAIFFGFFYGMFQN